MYYTVYIQCIYSVYTVCYSVLCSPKRGFIFSLLFSGPCGGKSSSLAHFTKALEARGYDVYTAPEVPTILMTGGCKYPGNDAGEILIEFEAALMKLQTQLEDSFIQARCGSSV